MSLDFGHLAFDFIRKTRSSGEMSDLVALAEVEIGRLGFTAIASGLVSGPKIMSGRPFHFSIWPPEWAALYAKEGFLLIDPVVRWARVSGTPVSWPQLRERLPPRDPGHRVIEAAARMGFRDGLAVPVRAEDNSMGLVSIGGSRGPLSQDEWDYLVLIARRTFTTAERIDQRPRGAQPAPVFSFRELDCLTLLVQGNEDKEIAKLLSISLPTVRFHIRNARTKICATSRTHLAALVAVQGFVSP